MTTLDIKVLGPGCRNCVTLDKAAHQAIEELGIEATYEKVEDYALIASYNVMSTPALVLNGEVVSVGRVPGLAEIKELILGANKPVKNLLPMASDACCADGGCC